MTDLTRTLGFKTTEPFFQQVITVADMQGLNKSDFVRNAVEAAVEKATTGLQASPALNPAQVVKTVIETPKVEAKPIISYSLLERRKKELQKQLLLEAGVRKLLHCLPFLIQLGGNGHSTTSTRM